MTEHTPHPAEDAVQKVVGIVEDGEQFVQGLSLCQGQQRVQLSPMFFSQVPLDGNHQVCLDRLQYPRPPTPTPTSST